MKAKTLEKLPDMGIYTLSYMIDNAFGPRRDPGLRLSVRCIPHCDLHGVRRDKNISAGRQRGARDVVKIRAVYEPASRLASPAGWPDWSRLTLNAESVLRFSSKRPERLREKMRVAYDVSLEGPAVRLDDLVQAEQRELLSGFDVLEKQ
jgi:hypothetical protein